MIFQNKNTKKEEMNIFLQKFCIKIVPAIILLISTVRMDGQCTFNCPTNETYTVPFGTCSLVVDYTDPTTSGVCTDTNSDFIGEFAHTNWSFNSSGNGTLSNTTTSATLTSNSNGIPGSSQYCITLDFHDHLTTTGQELSTSTGTLTFDYNYSSTDAFAGNDPFFITINGVATQITAGAAGAGATSQNGNSSQSVNDGDLFCFDQRSIDGANGSAQTIISNLDLNFSYIPTLVSGLADNTSFPLGTTTVSYEVYNPISGGNSLCSFDVSVTEDGTASGTISCNDNLQISLDESCEFLVTPAIILEGSNYGCLDQYSVRVYNETTGAEYGNTVTSANIGETLTVEVTAPNNNKCWGLVTVEDKNPPLLTCNSVWTRCDQEVLPGSTTPTAYTITRTPNLTITEAPSNENPVLQYQFTDSGLNGFNISDLNISLDITHPNISELSASLEYQVSSTSATSLGPISLFDFTSSSCSNANIVLTLDDESVFTYSSLETTCAASPAVSGTFMPQAALSAFDGAEGNGIFTLRIFDNSNNASAGTLDTVRLILTQDTNIVTFPGTEGATYTATSGTNSYTSVGSDPCGISSLTYNDAVENPDCTTSPYERIITRSWFVRDAQGNNSSCNQTIYVFRLDADDLAFPPNYDNSVGSEAALSCSVYGDTVPTPAVTGRPTGTFCDHYQIFDPIDTRLDICEKSYKIVRRWKVVNWCSGEIFEHDQIIKVEDTTGPVLTCPADMTISADTYQCSGTMTIDQPTIGDECSSTLTYRLFYVSADVSGAIPPDPTYTEVTATNGQYLVNNLPFGLTQIKWDVEDNCGNATTCTSLITVVDEIPPIAVCDEFSVVSLNNTGEAIAMAESFNNGSNDNCGIDRYQVRRTSSTCGGSTAFGESVQFCCNDIGQAVMVELVVYDTAGNSNTCLVEVSVQDKLAPVLTNCPANITLNCQTMDITNLEITGQPIPVDNCTVDLSKLVYTDSGSLDQCGEGVFTREWKFTDQVGLGAACIQTITVEDNDPFNSDDITWPLNYDGVSSSTNCSPSLLPSDIPVPFNQPILTDDFCSLTASTYEDKVFFFVEGACVKTIRTWTVIDWCTYNASTNAGLFTSEQILKIENQSAPTFTMSCADRDVCTYDDNCMGLVTLTQAVTDDCTPSNEITTNYVVTGPQNFTGSGLIFSETLATGTYQILWQAEDHCGNIGTCEYSFVVKDCKAPTPYCHSTVASVVMNNSGTLSIWANDFNLDSYDNCSSKENLVYSFSTDVTNQSLDLNCSHLPDGMSNIINLEMWVTDEAGNQNFCEVSIELQDNNADACADLAPGFSFIRGNIMTENAKMVSNVQVDISSNQSNLPISEMSTSVDGGYTFTSLPNYGNYYISSSKNDDLMNGVSTLDLAIIQRHILGVSLFDTPYKAIAADINNNQRVSSADLIILRKLILGIITELPNDQQSWRFVDRDDSFSDISDPFPFDEILDFVSLNQSQTEKDFVAVKIGDVNLNSNPSNYDESTPVTTRNVTTTLLLDDAYFVKGEEVIVPVYADQFNDMIGYQMSIDFDVSILEFADWEQASLNMSDDNFGFNNVHDGILTTSWVSIEEQTLDNSTPLFILKFKAKKSSQLVDVIDVNSIITSAEAYNIDFETTDLTLKFRDDKTLSMAGFEVYQNQPNPFESSTTIGFYTPVKTTAKLKVYDMAGRILHQESLGVTQGEHEFLIEEDDLNTQGLLYYSIEVNGQKVTKKMITFKK